MHTPPAPADAVIGVFDSGVGGLSVLQAIRARLAAEHLIYIADSRFAPYGDRDPDFIAHRAGTITRLLLENNAKAIVVACNTASVVAIQKIRAWCRVPVIAIEPAIKPAALHTRSGVVGVLATSRTIASASVTRLCAAHGHDIRILLQPCPGLVEQVEKGDLQSRETLLLLREYILPLLAQGVDTLVLGCTHYPFLGGLIRRIAGDAVTIIDPAPAVAMQLQNQLQQQHALRHAAGKGSTRFYSSGEPGRASTVISGLWGEQVTVENVAMLQNSRFSAAVADGLLPSLT